MAQGASEARDDEQATPPPVLPPPAPKGEKGTRYVLKATARGRKAWYKLGQAITALVGNAADGPRNLFVHVDVDARQPTGFDPVDMRNKVKEVLEESDVEHEAVLAKE